MIEKAQNSVGDFATIFSLFAGGEPGGEHVEVIKSANDFAQTIADVLINVKGLTRLSENDDASDKLAGTAKGAGDSALRAFLNLQSYKSPTQQTALRSASDVRSSLTSLSDIIDKVIPKAAGGGRPRGDAGDIVEQEMLSAAQAIDAATERIRLLMTQSRSAKYSKVDIQVHDSILSAALAITQAIAKLMQASIESQQEIVNQGRGSSTSQQFYKKNNRWTEGLISAAKAVAFATQILIESADGVLSGTHSPEQLIVASNEVAAATAQLVAASRVKASLMSKSQDRLEMAAKGVTEACKALVKQVKALVLQEQSLEDLDYKNMAVMEFKRREMEQQVEILKLEKELGAARHRLGAMRRAGYHTDETN
jgi:huntingtin-interacting protein 1-related protein